MVIFRRLMITVLMILSIYSISTSLADDTMNCPGECHCSVDGITVLVDCSGLQLTELPEFENTHVHILDLSDNQFTSIPPQLVNFEQLQYLDLSANSISRLKGSSLNGLISLRLLNLSKNNISNWSAINPKTLLEPTINLAELSLAENPLSSFSSNDENLLLISNSLRWLDLSHCKISKIMGTQVIQGMKELEHINLSGNLIRSTSDMISDSLKRLDLSNNKLTNLQPTMLANLPSLTYIDLSRNHRISLMSKQEEYVQSSTLKRIDLSFCNMDNIELEGFPNLMTAILKGNMIRQLTRESFINTKLLENLDISQNAIVYVEQNTFKKLKHLKVLNLSFNMISKIERDTFKENEILTNLDVSRNFISRFNRIVATSLTNLNMTWCQIMTIDPDALTGLPYLIDLDLSNNLIIDFPDALVSESLQSLDMSMNRLSSIRNTTFIGFPELTRISLSGNRFTLPFRKDYFADNVYLTELWLGDNPWTCNCHDTNLYNFYNFLLESPSKIWDKKSLRCMNPEELYGKTWEMACYFIWYPQSRMGMTEKVWTFFMVAVIAFAGCLCVVMTIKRAIEGRKQTARELERERNLEENRDLARENRMRMQQQAQLNAPDPRVLSQPPCYEDAILMPRLDASFASLNELGRSKNKRRRRKTVNENEDDNDNDNEEEVTVRRNRCRSEEILSMRDSTNVRSPRLTPRTHPLDISPIDRNRSSNEDEESEEAEEIHYHSTDILTLNHSPGPSHRVRPSISHTPVPSLPSSPPPRRNVASDNFEEIQNFDQSNNALNDGSPYAKRKLGHMDSFKGNKKQFSIPKVNEPSTSLATAIVVPSTDEFIVIDDHFGSNRKSSSSSEGSNEFVEISASRTSDVNSSSTEDGMVILHRPPSK